jgi:lincosamide nucleotidyltransferase A/C/D/E
VKPGSLDGSATDSRPDWRPVRVELVAPGRGWVDLHAVVFGSDGHGRQADIGGGHFDYPPDGFAEGMIGGRSVRCVLLEQQRRFHQRLRAA